MDAPTGSIRSALRRGEYLVAFDLAREAVAADAAGTETRWLGVLALARGGSPQRARRFFDEWGLAGADCGADDRLAEDLRGLDARIAKDDALAVGGPARERRCADAARRYEAIWRDTRGTYAGVNAATLWLFAGDRPTAARLAADVELATRSATPDSPEDRYWRAATLAECALVQGRVDDTAAWLADAAATEHADPSARASTRRQLRMICEHEGHSPALVEALAVPGVVHYTGHMAGPDRARFPLESEEDLRARVARALDDGDVGFGYGSLGAGSDVLVAEELLARGAKAHLFLPCELDSFVEAAVAPGGPDWLARFEHCLEHASSVTFATNERDATDPTLLMFNARVAMGCARLQARRLATEPTQLAIWDGGGVPSTAGTAAEVAAWRGAGLVSEVIGVPRADPRPHRAERGTPQREVRAVLIADFKGFGRLRDDQIRVYVGRVVTALGATLDGAGDAVLDRNLWGDGLMVFFDEPIAAARTALALQRAVAAVDLAGHGLPADLGMRVSLHAGPVMRLHDAVRGRAGYFGAEVTRAARIEPTTPEGEVYVTEAFAALLALDDPADLPAQYVGREATAKGYGIMPLYLLREHGSTTA